MPANRTKASVLNMLISFGGQLLTVFLTFISRIIFIRYFTENYLGVSGLFNSILTMLSLAELGVGNAMIYSLYKPVAEHDENKVRKLMNLYRLLYRFVAAVVAGLGLMFLPFLDYFIKGDPGIPHLKFIYLIYLTNTALTYLFSYKQSIIMANQKEYINRAYTTLVQSIQILLQIMVIVLTSNFYLYLLIQLLGAVTTNWLLARKADRMYPFLREDHKALPEKSEIREIFKNISALLLHRIGGKMVHNTDNLVISAFIGLAQVGIYSNYRLIMNTMTTLVSHVYQAFTASIGNLVVVESEEKSYQVFKTLNFLMFLVFGYCFAGLFVLVNPFVRMIFGEYYLLDMTIIVWSCLEFYLRGMRQIILRFRDAKGLFWNDRYKPVAAALVNLVVSLALVRYYGIGGVLMGTVASEICVNYWIEPYILMRHGFSGQWKRRLALYYTEFGIETVWLFLMTWLLYYVCGIVPGDGIISFLAKGILLTVVYGGSVVLVFHRKPEMKEIYGRIKPIVRGRHKT